MLPGQVRVNKLWDMIAVYTNVFIARRGAERCRVTPASKLSGRFTQSTRQLPSRLWALNRKHSESTFAFTMSGQPGRGLSNEQVQQFQRDGEHLPRLYAGCSANACKPACPLLVFVPFWVADHPNSVLRDTRSDIQGFLCWRTLRLLRRCKGYAAEQTRFWMVSIRSLCLYFPPSPRSQHISCLDTPSLTLLCYDREHMHLHSCLVQTLAH